MITNTQSEQQKESKNSNKEVQDLIFYSKDTTQVAEKVSKMIEEIDFTIKNDIGDNLLMLSARRNMQHISETMFDYLLSKNEYKHILDSNNENENLLMVLVKKGNFNLFEKAIKNKNLVSMLNQTNKFGKTIHSLAKDYNRKEINELLNNQQ